MQFVLLSPFKLLELRQGLQILVESAHAVLAKRAPINSVLHVVDAWRIFQEDR